MEAHLDASIPTKTKGVKPLLTPERLRELLHYDPDTGIFTWTRSTSNRAVAGKTAGCATPSGYVLLRIDDVLYKAHRLAWFYAYAVWPSKGLDHINRIPCDNRLQNLREANQSENMQNAGPQKNNRSGIPGVFFTGKSWSAYIAINKKRTYLGFFKTKSEAVSARFAAAARLHPFAPRQVQP